MRHAGLNTIMCRPIYAITVNHGGGFGDRFCKNWGCVYKNLKKTYFLTKFASKGPLTSASTQFQARLTSQNCMFFLFFFKFPKFKILAFLNSLYWIKHVKTNLYDFLKKLWLLDILYNLNRWKRYKCQTSLVWSHSMMVLNT